VRAGKEVGRKYHVHVWYQRCSGLGIGAVGGVPVYRYHIKKCNIGIGEAVSGIHLPSYFSTMALEVDFGCSKICSPAIRNLVAPTAKWYHMQNLVRGRNL